MSLRSKIIRLAHENPELRPHLLLLLRKRASEEEAEADEAQAEADEDKARAKREEADAERLKQGLYEDPEDEEMYHRGLDDAEAQVAPDRRFRNNRDYQDGFVQGTMNELKRDKGRSPANPRRMEESIRREHGWRAARSKRAAVDKVPVFSQFETTLTTRDIEKMFLRHYPMAVKGSLQIDPKTRGRPLQMGRMHLNITMDNGDPNAEDYERVLTGSLIMAFYPRGNQVRCMAFVNVDG